MEVSVALALELEAFLWELRSYNPDLGVADFREMMPDLSDCVGASLLCYLFLDGWCEGCPLNVGMEPGECCEAYDLWDRCQHSDLEIMQESRGQVAFMMMEYVIEMSYDVFYPTLLV